MRGKTRDGLPLSKILKVVRGIEGISIRDGTRHPFVLSYEGLRACPIAESTDARKMLVPWLRDATGYKPATIYESLRKGKWR
jgi:hypothetical protein